MNKKASSELNEVWWRVATVLFVFLVFGAVYGWAVSVAKGEDVFRRYTVKDIAGINGVLSHIDGDAEAYYSFPISKEKFSIEDYIISSDGSWVSLRKEGNNYKTYADYLRNSDIPIKMEIKKDDSIIWVKKGDRVVVGSTPPEEIEPCARPHKAPERKSVLFNPSYEGEYPGRENKEFKDSHGAELIEAEKTFDYIPVSSIGYGIGDVKTTRERGEKLPPQNEIIESTKRHGAFITVLLGEDDDEQKGEVIAEFKGGSELSRYLACLISEKISSKVADVTGKAIVPSDERIVKESHAEASVLVRIGNVRSNTNKVLDSSNTIRIKEAISDAIREYYENEKDE
ncbi:hypothetical protein D6764_05105 [Candidatus Woesearchaeota archaeon]|nr:MAG: hypothetical protein D6764_05105 [Candidatus Woesearchaeota archaeon]